MKSLASAEFHTQALRVFSLTENSNGASSLKLINGTHRQSRSTKLFEK